LNWWGIDRDGECGMGGGKGGVNYGWQVFRMVSVQHMTQHPYNDTSLPQEINAYTHHCPLLTTGNNLTVFEKLFQMWFL